MSQRGAYASISSLYRPKYCCDNVRTKKQRQMIFVDVIYGNWVKSLLMASFHKALLIYVITLTFIGQGMSCWPSSGEVKIGGSKAMRLQTSICEGAYEVQFLPSRSFSFPSPFPYLPSFSSLPNANWNPSQKSHQNSHSESITFFGRILNFYSAPQCSHCKRCTSYGNSDRLSVRLSLRLSVCLSHAGIVSKQRHVARCSVHCQVAKCV